MAWQGVPRIHEARLFRKRNVVGVGIAKKVAGGRQTDEPCVVVFVERKVPRAQLRPKDLVPATIEAMKTDVVETGRIQALQARTARWRPAPGGVSVGHYRITAGTLGVVARRAGVRMILSNNHVLANANAASIGDAILQPGPYDGGTAAQDRIATLEAFVPIVFDGFLDFLLSLFCIARPVRNVVDAALGKPLSDADMSDEVLEIGRVSGTASGAIDMPVRKSGRTTGLTEGRITTVAATVRVFYGLTRSARFRDQLVASALSQGGDSGSLIVNADDHAVGLLFAGSSNTTILNPIDEVERLLGIGF